MKKSYWGISLFFLFSFLFVLSSDIFAVGALYVRPRNSTQQYQKMWIKKIDTKIDIQEQIAVTHVDQTFNNELNTSVEAIYLFPLPANATISELVYWVNGVRYVAEIKERQQAVSEYNQKLRQWLDPALLEYLGNNLFRLSIVPINANSDVRTEITYVEPLSYDFGNVNYLLKLNTLSLSSKPLQTVSVSIDATSKFPYKRFYSPSYANSTAAKITKISDNHYTFLFADENFYPDRDLSLQFETQRSGIEYHALSYKPSVQDSIGTDNFYSIWITPPDSLTAGDEIPKDIVFTADVSSSMDGKRMDQLKETLNNFLSLLTDKDKFNIIKFGTNVVPFKNDLVYATQNNINDAKNFVFQLSALGTTNIDDALTKSLSQSYGDSTSNDLIFLTDGTPTFGDTSNASILSHVKQNNKNNVRIFSFGIGDEVSKSLLQDLSDQNHGYAKFIASNDSIALVVNDHFKRISKPVLTDITLDLGGVQSWDQYPKTISDLFWGNQVMILGLYKNGGSFDVTLKGMIRSKAVEFKQSICFSDTIGGHRFVPRLWAKAKIDYLLQLIAAYGEIAELKQQIIELSLRFQILTPYTAFYVDPKTGLEEEKKDIPERFALAQNYPNPFNPETKITYSLPLGRSSYHVVIKIYNTLGQLIRVLIDSEQPSGNYTLTWNGKDMNNMNVPSGVYIYSIQAEGFNAVRKMVLLR
ncbi:MAG: VIT domain-containing protein [Bacteroidota bacterium]|nr:VIT domain-containing protein [Bacteroidota bacterium]